MESFEKVPAPEEKADAKFAAEMLSLGMLNASNRINSIEFLVDHYEERPEKLIEEVTPILEQAEASISSLESQGESEIDLTAYQDSRAKQAINFIKSTVIPKLKESYDADLHALGNKMQKDARELSPADDIALLKDRVTKIRQVMAEAQEKIKQNENSQAA